MKKSLIAILILLLLVACNNDNEVDDPLSGAVIEGTQTVAPTPTLVPGLPTETPQSVVSQPGETVPTATAIPTITPTATPEPAERFPRGQSFFFYENYEAAVPEYQLSLAAGVLDGLQTQEALLKLGQSFYHLGQYQAAAETFNELLAQLPSETEETAETDGVVQTGQIQPSDAYFWLAQSYQNQGDCPAAIGAYESYLAINLDMAAYVQPAIANCHLILGDRTAAMAAYEAATDGEAQNLVRLNLHQQLADMYLADENYAAAIAEYEAILSFAVTDGTRGQAHYLIGTIALTAGDDGTANENFLIAVTEYPTVSASYQSLIALIDAGFEVDQFQRGLIDYYAEVYEPAVVAFTTFIEANPTHREDVHLYLAWSYEGLGNVTAAIAEIDAYIEANEPAPTSGEETEDETQTSGDLTAVATGLLEKGKLQARAGLYPEAISAYQSYLERFPDGADAPFAVWWSAALTEALEDIPGAIIRYQEMAANYPDHQDADEALFIAGSLERSQGNEEEAILLWQQTAETYPDQVYGGAALLWLLKALPPEEAEPYREIAIDLLEDNYYTLRAAHEAQDIPPFFSPETIDLELNSEGQAATETWLKNWLQLDSETVVSGLSPELLADSRLVRGAKLWRLGLREAARLELEAVRQGNRDNALHSYQLAIFFRDIGLYRSSILSAEAVMNQALVNALTAPRFLARLAYPIYYADLITAEAQQYGYDPLLQFALIRQESLYESFAISTAVAQGLSQVIPDTGEYIATRLGWPNYENDDLYRPYVGIAFGAYYLDQQLDAFDDFVPAALSAYNAGPGNAARWYDQVSDDIDRYHEIVNFAETRLYIERIYIGQAIYRHLYGVPDN